MRCKTKLLMGMLPPSVAHSNENYFISCQKQGSHCDDFSKLLEWEVNKMLKGATHAK